MLLLFFFSTLLLTGCGGESNQEQPAHENQSGRDLSFSEGTLAFWDPAKQDTVAKITIALADEPQERNEGLMDVSNLPRDAGMLFIFDQEQERSFWMANTPLPLDIIFVNADMKIVTIHHRTQPYSQEQYASTDEAKYVVETNAGFCQGYDIREGMHITFDIAP
jgi:uncharacterized membrane protein (UPF0127 family)